MHKIGSLFRVSRPISWVNTAFPFAAGYIVSGGSFDALCIIGTLYFLIPYNLFMYGVNDVFDYESDIRNPRKGSIEGAKEAKSLHPTIISSILVTNLPFVVYFIATGSLLSSIILVAVLFFVGAYSFAGLRFKEIPFLDSITSSLHFVGPLVFALSVTNSLSVPESWPFIVAFFLWGMASHAFGAVQDIIPDRDGGLRSIATYIGARSTVRLSVILYAISSVIVSLQGVVYIPIALCGLLYVANIVMFWSVSDEGSLSTNRAWRRFIWLNLITGFVVTITLIFRIV